MGRFASASEALGGVFLARRSSAGSRGRGRRTSGSRLPRGMLEVAVAPGLGLDRAPARGIGGKSGDRAGSVERAIARDPGSGVRRSAAPAPCRRGSRGHERAPDAVRAGDRRRGARCPCARASGGRPAPGARASGSRGSRPSRGPYAADGLTGPPVRLYNRAMAVQTLTAERPPGVGRVIADTREEAAPPAATAAWRAQLQPPPDPPLPARHAADNARVSRPLRRRVLGADVPPGDGGDARPGREPLRHGVRRRQLQLARGDVRRTADPADRRRADHDRLGVPRPRA